jgi:hypothetical protein
VARMRALTSSSRLIVISVFELSEPPLSLAILTEVRPLEGKFFRFYFLIALTMNLRMIHVSVIEKSHHVWSMMAAVISHSEILVAAGHDQAAAALRDRLAIKRSSTAISSSLRRSQ